MPWTVQTMATGALLAVALAGQATSAYRFAAAVDSYRFGQRYAACHTASYRAGLLRWLQPPPATGFTGIASADLGRTYAAAASPSYRAGLLYRLQHTTAASPPPATAAAAGTVADGFTGIASADLGRTYAAAASPSYRAGLLHALAPSHPEAKHQPPARCPASIASYRLGLRLAERRRRRQRAAWAGGVLVPDPVATATTVVAGGGGRPTSYRFGLRYSSRSRRQAVATAGVILVHSVPAPRFDAVCTDSNGTATVAVASAATPGSTDGGAGSSNGTAAPAEPPRSRLSFAGVHSLSEMLRRAGMALDAASP